MKREGSAEDILQTAAELFRQRGYQGTSLSAIGDRLGMTAAAIYYHFRSKEEILFTHLDRAMRELIARSDQAVARATSPRQRLEAFVVTHVTLPLEPLGILP